MDIIVRYERDIDMKRGSPAAGVIGGTIILALDAWGISRGRLPLKGRFDDVIDVTETPRLFWGYAISLGAVGAAALIWGLVRGLRR